MVLLVMENPPRLFAALRHQTEFLTFKSVLTAQGRKDLYILRQSGSDLLIRVF